MPYKSLAQMRKFHSDPKLKRFTSKMDQATKAAGGFKGLPNHVGDTALAGASKFGGVVAGKAKKSAKKISPRVAELAKKMVNTAMESPAGEKAEGPVGQKVEGGASAERMEQLRSLRGKKKR